MNFFKKNIYAIVSFSLLLLILSYSSISFVNEKNVIDKKNEENISFCYNNDYKGTEYENYCKKILDDQNVKIDFFTTYTNIVVAGLGKYSFVMFLFIIMPSLYGISRYLKNRIILEEITRMKYKKIKNKLLIEAYIPVLIIPIIILISFFICYFISGGFDTDYSIKNSTSVWSESTLKTPLLFMSLYLLNSFFHSIIYLNIALCIARKHHNYFVAVILSFLTYIGIEAILEIGLNGILFTTILKSNSGMIFNIMNFITFNDTCGTIPILFFSGTIMIFSFIVVWLKYKNKEKLIFDCEFNE